MFWLVVTKVSLQGGARSIANEIERKARKGREEEGWSEDDWGEEEEEPSEASQALAGAQNTHEDAET